MADIEIDITSAQQEQPDIDVHPVYGPKGANGANGRAATIEVGTVRTGAAGTTAIITNSGDSSNAVFNFTIPKGDTGEQGIQGETGATGNGIETIEKTSTSGLVDTYTITYTDDTTSTFTLTNGQNGANATITGATASVDNSTGTPSVVVTAGGSESARSFNFAFSNLKGSKGEQGIQGETGVSVTGVTLLSTVGLDKTYRMTFSDNTYFDYVVSNGASGSTEWGGISGVLSNQTDLQSALNGKYDSSNPNGYTSNIGTVTSVNNITPVNGNVTLEIPDNQIQSDWNEADTTSKAYIQNKPTLATVATSGSYNDLTNKPTIPVQAQADWSQSDNDAPDYIKNKPNFATVATSGSYNDLTNKPTLDKYYAGTGISITPKLATTVDVECSNPNLTVTSSYDDTESTTGVINYEFEYKRVLKYSGTKNYDLAGYTNHYIINGKLYYQTNDTFPGTLVDNSGKWTCVAGSSYTSGFSLGINNGLLYFLNKTNTPVKIGDYNDWDSISESYATTNTNLYGYAIRNGELYSVNNGSATRVGTESGWSIVSGSSYVNSSDGMYSYGICNGQLYSLYGNTANKIHTDNKWTIVRGPSAFNSASLTALGICNGKLYEMRGSGPTITQIGTDNGWTNISGRQRQYNMPALGIRNGQLYKLTGNPMTATLLNNNRNWKNTVDLGEGSHIFVWDENDVLYLCNYGNSPTQFTDNITIDNIFVSSAGVNFYCIKNYNSTTKAFYHYTFNTSSATLIGSAETRVGWYLNNTQVDLNNGYDLTVTGTPQVNDTIDLTYTTTGKPNEYVISATEGE